MGNDTVKERNNKRYRRCNTVTGWLDILYIVVVCILVLHLFILQIIDPNRYREKGKMQRASHDFQLRGDIFDRNGIKLATDRIYYNIFARPVDYTKRETPEKIAGLLSPILGIPKQTLQKKLSDKSIKVIAVKKNVDRDTAKKIMKIIAENKDRKSVV